MSSTDKRREALKSIVNSFRSRRLAHAYILIGPVRGEALALANDMARMVMCASTEPPCGSCPGCKRVTERNHPDVIRLEPQSKSRRITAEDIRALCRDV
jgi:DNA polymerase III gamma/tau subunit